MIDKYIIIYNVNKKRTEVFPTNYDRINKKTIKINTRNDILKAKKSWQQIKIFIYETYTKRKKNYCTK